MKFSIATVLALASAAIASPTPGNLNLHQCKYIVCTNAALFAVDLDLDVSLASIFNLGLDLDILFAHHRKCKAVWCCPTECKTGERIPGTCQRYRS